MSRKTRPFKETQVFSDDKHGSRLMPIEPGQPSVRVQPDSGLAKLAGLLLNRPRAIEVVRLIKKARTKVALILLAWCLAEGVLCRERPLSLVHLNPLELIGLLLIGSGLAFRLAALGCLRKKESLASDGVYSLCRHPLYLGSILLAYGFCILLADAANYVLVTAYFLLFYPVTILWEEFRLLGKYGEAHRQYCASTPLLLPTGNFRIGAFTWHAAMSKGGTVLLMTVFTLLAIVQVMAAAL